MYTHYLDVYPTSAPNIYQINVIKELLKCDEIELYLIHHQKCGHPLYKETQEIIVPKTPLICEQRLKKYKLDIIHFNDIPWLLGVLFPLLKCKKVATVYGDEQFIDVNLTRNKYKAIPRRYIQPITSKYLHAIVAISYDLKLRLSTLVKIPKSKIKVIYPGLDPSFRVIKKSDMIRWIKEKYGIDRPFIFHISSFCYRKNPYTLIKTFKQLLEEGLDLDLVISGDGWNHPNVISLINRFDLSKRVKLIGYAPKEDVILLYNAAEVVFQPSFHENFGFPIVESMACGTPVISSNVYSIPEVSGNAALLYDPNDYEGFVNGIKMILKDKKLRKDLIKKGFENVKRFSWERCAKETYSLYRELISQS